jgi:ketosteroid isomerase-like protein
VDEYRELDDVRVLVLIRCSARGKTSGLEVGQVRTESATLFHIRDGKVVKLFVYLDRECALAALGRGE